VQSVGGVRAGLDVKAGEPRPRSAARICWLLLFSFVIKFAAQTVSSALLNETPVLLKGPRHITSFLLGFLLVWFSPGDQVFTVMSHSLAVKLLLSMCSGLYRLRKALFSMEVALALYSWPGMVDLSDITSNHLRCIGFCALLVIIALDGNGVLKDLLLWTERCIRASQSLWSHLTGENLRRVFFMLLSVYVVPDMLVTLALLLFNGSQLIELRIALLVYNFNKQGTFDLLDRIHFLGAPPVAATANATKAKKKKLT
jgi:hypothetical protein